MLLGDSLNLILHGQVPSDGKQRKLE
jgi:hypothetical protein